MKPAPRALLKLSGEDAKARWNFYSQLAAMHYDETGRTRNSRSNKGQSILCPLFRFN